MGRRQGEGSWQEGGDGCGRQSLRARLLTAHPTAPHCPPLPPTHPLHHLTLCHPTLTHRPELNARHNAFQRGSAYLERYCMTIAFTSYLQVRTVCAACAVVLRVLRVLGGRCAAGGGY